MNLDICKNCKKRPDFYHVVFIEEQFMKLEGLKADENYRMITTCYLYITDKEQIDKIEEELILLRAGEFKAFKPEKIYNKNNKADETCCYYAEHQLYDWNDKNE